MSTAQQQQHHPQQNGKKLSTAGYTLLAYASMALVLTRGMEQTTAPTDSARVMLSTGVNWLWPSAMDALIPASSAEQEMCAMSSMLLDQQLNATADGKHEWQCADQHQHDKEVMVRQSTGVSTFVQSTAVPEVPATAESQVSEQQQPADEPQLQAAPKQEQEPQQQQPREASIATQNTDKSEQQPREAREIKLVPIEGGKPGEQVYLLNDGIHEPVAIVLKTVRKNND